MNQTQELDNEVQHAYQNGPIGFSITLRDGKSELTIEETIFNQYLPLKPNEVAQIDASIIGMTGSLKVNEDSTYYFKLARTPGVRSFQRLFLRSFSQFPDPRLASPLTGTPAATLYEATNPNTSKTKKPNWLMCMLIVEAHRAAVDAKQILSFSQVLQKHFFRAGEERKNYIGSVNLGNLWQCNSNIPHQFIASIVDKGVRPAHPSTYLILSEVIAAQMNVSFFFENKKLIAGVRKTKGSFVRLEQRKVITYLIALYNEAGIIKSWEEIDSLFDNVLEKTLDDVPMAYVELEPENALKLFKAALNLPIPRLEDNLVTLSVTTKPDAPPRTASLRVIDSAPPDEFTSEAVMQKRLDLLLEYIKNMPPSKDPTTEDTRKKLLSDLQVFLEKSGRSSDRINIREGSTILTVKLNLENSLRLEHGLVDGQIELPEEIVVEWERAQPVSWQEKISSVEIKVTEPTSPGLRQGLHQAYMQEFFLRPWRRLYSLLWFNPAQSPSASVLGKSVDRAYGNSNVGLQLRSLISDLKMGWLLWPFLTCILVAVSCVVANMLGQPTNLRWGLATGLVLSLIGAQPCSYVVSPLACHAGAIFVGWAFGFSGALLAGIPDVALQLTGSYFLADPFRTVTGGLMGLSAPFWRPTAPATHGLSFGLIVLMLAFTGTGIGMSAWLMGQPKTAQTVKRPRGLLPDWAGAVLGFFAGGAIKGVQALTDVLVKHAHIDPVRAFACAFSLVGGTVMMAMIGWQNRSSRGVAFRAIAAGIVHAVIAFALVETTFGAAHHSSIVVSACLVSATCGYFHSTWFSAAYVLGESLSTARGAVWAAILEGIPFYIAFLISTMLHKPIF